MSIRKDLSLALKCVKDERGWSYKEVAKHTGLSVSSVRLAMNNGGEGIGLDTFQTLVDFFKIDIEVSYIVWDFT